MSSGNTQIAKNAAFLYFRKGIAILIGLYSARLLLKELGDADYGLYGLVGSVVIMFNALRYLFTDSVQRYINVAKGSGNGEKISEIFSVGVNVHILLAIILVVALETGGSFLVAKLNVGEVSKWEVQTLFQLSIFTTVITLLTVPYDAVIIANERFNAFAYLSILDIALRFSSVLILFVIPSYKVIWYAIMLFIVALLVRIVNMIYCKHEFKDEVKYIGLKNKALTLEMVKFAGWNFLGNIGYWVAMSGTDLILNRFGGLLINASRSIANQIFSNFQQFIGDLNTSFRPRSMILYSEGKLDDYYKLSFLNTRSNFMICSVLSLTFIAFAHPILKIWLGTVPEYAVVFSQIILLYSIIRSLRGPLDIFFKVTGKLKYFQISECIITLSNLPISWVILSLGAPLYSVFIIMTILEIFNYISMVFIATHFYGFRGADYLRSVVSRIIVVSLLLVATYSIFSRISEISQNIFVEIILCILVFFTLALGEIAILFTSQEKKNIMQFIKQIANKK